MVSLPVVLIGLPGSDVSSIATAVAERLGRIASEVGPSTLNTAVNSAAPAVHWCGVDLATGPDARRVLRRQALTIWLDSDDHLLAESSSGSIDGLDDSQLLLIRKLRRAHLGHLTTSADAIVALDGRSKQQIVDATLEAIAAASGRDKGRHLTETVAFHDGRSYPIHVGRGVVELLPALIPATSKRVAIITQAGIDVAVPTGRDERTFLIEDGEIAKRLEVAGELASDLAQWGLTRGDCVVSVGGGVVSDVAGFVAASYHRGTAVVHVATTLLGQIDAAIGGKTGVNLPEGKNLFGAYWQPTAVICEIDALDTLAPRDFVAGMGELAKYHFLGGGELDRLPLVERVAEAVHIKAEVVSGDEREGGRRAILNYGHTLAHALETAGRYDLRHGEAVGIGLIYAAELAHRLGRIDAARVEEHRRVVRRYGLSPWLPDGYDLDELVSLFDRDKKAVAGKTFVLDGPQGVEPVMVDDEALLKDVLTALVGSERQ